MDKEGKKRHRHGRSLKRNRLLWDCCSGKEFNHRKRRREMGKENKKSKRRRKSAVEGVGASAARVSSRAWLRGKKNPERIKGRKKKGDQFAGLIEFERSNQDWGFLGGKT